MQSYSSIPLLREHLVCILAFHILRIEDGQIVFGPVGREEVSFSNEDVAVAEISRLTTETGILEIATSASVYDAASFGMPGFNYHKFEARIHQLQNMRQVAA